MKRKGFTNLEVMMAVAIFGIMIVSVMKLNSKSIKSVNTAGSSLSKAYYAQMKAEQYKSNVGIFQSPANSEIKNNSTYYFFTDTSDPNYDVLVEWCWLDKNQLLRDVFITVKDKNSGAASPSTLEFYVLQSNS